MVTLHTAETRATRQQERAANAAEEAVAEARLEEERESAEKAATGAKRLEEEAAAANKRPRRDGGQQLAVDLTAEDVGTRKEDIDAHIQNI